MYIRCANCQGTVWLDTGVRLPLSLQTTCSRCQQDYRLKTPVSCLGMTSSRLHQVATSYARDLVIDLPAAYSVVLGVLQLDDVREFGSEASIVCRTLERRRERAHEGRFDPEFIPAVEAGTLSADQASQRGKREAFARQLVLRHRLSLEAAYEVADNRKSLLEAIQDRIAVSVIDARIATQPYKTLAAAAVFLLLAGVLLGSWRRNLAIQARMEVHAVTVGVPAVTPRTDTGRKTREEVLAAATRTESGDDGLPRRIVGPDPQSVLVRLCKSRTQACLEPYKVESTVPPNPKARLGLFRNYDSPETVMALTIRQDPRTRRWVLGDGETPIEAVPAPEAARIAYHGG